MIGIVISRQDDASMLIGKQLRQLGAWEERHDDSREEGDGGGVYYRNSSFSLREFDTLHIDLQNVENAFVDIDTIVFPSRHAGETGKLLTTHFTGNIGPAEYGGKPNSVSLAAPHVLSRIHSYLANTTPPGYAVGIEATHHGPLVTEVPSLFVEIGSSESEWNDSAPAETVARAILDLETEIEDSDRVIVGFGGGHYAPRFERILTDTDWSLGHIAAEWSLDQLSPLESEVIDQLFERSNTELALIDGDRPSLESYLNSHGYRVVSETWLRKTSGVPLTVVSELEGALGSIDDGLRFGAEIECFETYDIYQIAPELIEKATSLDASRTKSVVEDNAIGFHTKENGNLITGKVAVASAAKLHEMLNGIIDIFTEEFAEVNRSPDSIRVTDREFRPDLAKKHGVPEGPAFGRLAAGESVEINGTTVTPEMVFKEYTETFPLTFTKHT